MADRRTQRRRVLALVAFPLWVAATTAALLEVGLHATRSLWLADRDTPRSDGLPGGSAWLFGRYHPVLGYAGLPDISRDFVFGTRATQNGRGERGPELPLERRPGTFRLLTLGDSQAWGWGVGDGGTIAAETARDLAGRGVGDVEAVNLGTCGYGIDQSLLRWVLDGRAYAPDAVVLVYFPSNDLAEVLSSIAYGVEKPRFALRGDDLCLTNVPVPRAEGWPEGDLGSRLVRWVAEHVGRGVAQALGRTNLAAFLRTRTAPRDTRDEERRALAEAARAFPCTERPGEAPPGATPAPARKLTALQARMRDEGPDGVTAEAAPLAARLVREIAARVPPPARFLVLVVPTGDRMARGAEHPAHARFLAALADAGIEVVDGAPVLREPYEQGGAFLDGNRDPHLSARGIAAVSAVLADALEGGRAAPGSVSRTDARPAP